ncbi:N-acetyltransferase family protein [Chitinophaga lutea]
MLTIANARPDQMPLIREIAYATWPSAYHDILTEEQMSYMLHMMYADASLQEQTEKKGHVFLIAEWNGEPGGFASYEMNYGGEPVCKLHKIYVLPSMQGRQVGKALMGAVEKTAREAGMKKFSLNVNRHNIAVGFYQRMGFEKVGDQDIDIGNGFFMYDAVMERNL